MKSFNPAVIIELAKEGFIFFLLTKFELLSGDYFYTDADIDFSYDGNTYDSADFIFDQVDMSAGLGIDSVSLTYNNANLSIGALVLSEDILGRPFTLSFACAIEGSGELLTEVEESLLTESGEGLLLDFPAQIGGYSIAGGNDLFYGYVSDWKISEDSVWIEIQNELSFWSKRVLRKSSSSCPWEFKGTECGYSGSQSWCDQSYERCNALMNTGSFGGFRFLPTIAEKEVWWGRST